MDSLFSNGSNSKSLLRCSSFSTHHLSCGMALSRSAGKDNKVIINDVGSWPWLKGPCFLSCVALWLNVDTAYTSDPQHFSSTWWLGESVKHRVQNKAFLRCLCCLRGFTVTQYSLCSPFWVEEKEWNTLWISAKWIDVWGEKKHNQSSRSRWKIITGQLLMNRMSENWPHVGSWRTVESNYIWFSG